MGNFRSGSSGGFSRGGRSGGSRFGGSSRSFGDRGGFRGGDRDSGRFERRPMEMHNVTCDKCGKQCQVPFKPTEGKPVYCSDCFRQNSNSGSNFGSRTPERSSQSGISQEQFNQIDKKLNKILKALQELELDTEGEDDEVELLEEDEDEDDGEDSKDSPKAE